MEFQRRFKQDGSSELYGKQPNGRWRGIYHPDNIEVQNAQSITDMLYVAPKATPAPTNNELIAATDMEFIGVSEHLLTALLKKGLIALTDLPQETQDKYQYRRALRAE